MDCGRTGSIGTVVNQRMACRTQTNQVFLRIIAALAAEFLVVNLQV
jgi:hypothetical protein